MKQSVTTYLFLRPMSFAISARGATEHSSLSTFVMISLPITLFRCLFRVIFLGVVFKVIFIVIHFIHLIHLILKFFVIFICRVLLCMMFKVMNRLFFFILLLRVVLTRWRTRRDGCWRSNLFGGFWKDLDFLLRRGWFWVEVGAGQLRFCHSFGSSCKKATDTKWNESSILFILGIVPSICTLWVPWRSSSSWKFLNLVCFLICWALIMYRERRDWGILLYMRGIKVRCSWNTTCSTVTDLWRIDQSALDRSSRCVFMVIHESITGTNSVKTIGKVLLLGRRRANVAHGFRICWLFNIIDFRDLSRWLRFVIHFLLSISWVIYLGNTSCRDTTNTILTNHSSAPKSVSFDCCCCLRWQFLHGSSSDGQ